MPLFPSKKTQEDRRYYLLPGMGKSNRRWHRKVLLWSIAFALLFSAVFGGLLYFLNGR